LAIASLCDAFQVPKPLSRQLLPFGISDDDLGELTFEVGLFLVLSVWCGRSARGQRTVCEEPVSRELFVFLFRFVLIWFCFRFPLQPVCGRPKRGQSARSSRMVCFSRVGFGGSVRFNGRSAAQARQSAARVCTVRGTLPDGPHGHRGRSALSGRTVRQRLAALLLGWIPPFLSRASACASRNCS
jgi:hypothetical protein